MVMSYLNNFKFHFLFQFVDHFRYHRFIFLVALIGIIGSLLSPLLANPEPVSTQNQSEIGTGNKQRGSSPADKRQWLAGNRDKVYRYRHVDKCLHRQHKCRTEDKVFWKELFDFPGNHPRPDQDDDIEQQHKDSSNDPHLLDNYRVDEVGISLGKEVALGTVSRELAKDAAVCDGNLGMSHLIVVVSNRIVSLIRHLLMAAKLVEPALPGSYTA